MQRNCDIWWPHAKPEASDDNRTSLVATHGTVLRSLGLMVSVPCILLHVWVRSHKASWTWLLVETLWMPWIILVRRRQWTFYFELVWDSKLEYQCFVHFQFHSTMNCNAHGTKAMQCYQPGHLAEALHQICSSRRGSDFDRFTKRRKDIKSINLLNLVGFEGTVFLRATKQNCRYF